jgi:hypothetical protein
MKKIQTYEISVFCVCVCVCVHASLLNVLTDFHNIFDELEALQCVISYYE